MTTPAPEPPRIADAYAPPTTPAPLPGPLPPPRRTDRATLGQRIAGGLLVANALMVLTETILLQRRPGAASLPAPAGSIPSILDVIIGVALLSGTGGAVATVAMIRLGLGLVLLGGVFAFTDPFRIVPLILVCSALFLLLLKDASKLRIAVAGAGFGLYTLLWLAGISAELLGHHPLAALIQVSQGDIDSRPAGVVTGEAEPYRLKAPSDRWHLRKPEKAHKDNPLADRWLTRPDVDAHVMVIVETMPGSMVNLDKLVEVVLDNARKSAASFEMISQEPLRAYPEQGRLLHTRTRTNGLDVEYYYGVIATYEHAYQVVGFSSQQIFPEVEGELRAAVESFELPATAQALPPDVEAAPAGRIEGVAQRYSLTAPNEKWHLRKEAAAKQDNPLADRWLTRPDSQAHIMVIAEQVPGAKVSVEAYADAVAAAVKTGNPNAEVLGREPLRTGDKSGLVLHVKASTNGLPIESYYGAFAYGDVAFQVIGFAEQSVFPSVQGELLQIIESFTPPKK
jgi:hypothetical protein